MRSNVAGEAPSGALNLSLPAGRWARLTSRFVIQMASG
jgi:hypothetical protein